MAIEVEDKFDVLPDYRLPELGDVEGCVAMDGPERHRLVAIYFDTVDRRLLRRGVTLRRRHGGTDSGWHLKLPKAKGVRQEITRPYGVDAERVPEDLVDLVTAYTRGVELVPIARLDTERAVTRLLDADGAVLAEIADDQVEGVEFGTGEAVGEAADGSRGEDRTERWREIEVELINGDVALLRRIGEPVLAAGATRGTAASKLARLLTDRSGVGPYKADAAGKPAPTGSAGSVVLGYLRAQFEALLAHDPRVRRAEDDAVHQMRVACRRLRSALRSFRSIVSDSTELQDELGWLGQALSEARDLEVMRARFARHLRALDEQDDEALDERDDGRFVDPADPVRSRLDADLTSRERAAYDQARNALRSAHYLELLGRLEDYLAAPSLTDRAAGKPDKVLTKIAKKSWDRVTRMYERAKSHTDPVQREHAMHDVRKAAKRARYTAEAVAPVRGASMTKLAKRAESVQETLGRHQDCIVAQQFLRTEAEKARAEGLDVTTYEALVDVERAEAEQATVEFERLWIT